MSGLTLLFVTHDIALASELADQIAVLYKRQAGGAGFGQPRCLASRSIPTRGFDRHAYRAGYATAKRLAEIDASELQ